jgi:CrcB protein
MTTAAAALAVTIGAAIGAPARYVVSAAVQRRCHRRNRDEPGRTFPWGTCAANVIGSCILGAAAATTTQSSWWGTAIRTGLCGALTTFSTFELETVRLLESGRSRRAAGYVLISLALAGGGFMVSERLGTLLVHQ